MDKQEKLVEIFEVLFPRRQVMKSADIFLKSIGIAKGLSNKQKKQFATLNEELYQVQVDEFVRSVSKRFTDNEINRLFTFYNSVIYSQWNIFNFGFLPKLMNYQFEGGKEIQEKFNGFLQSIVDENGPIGGQDEEDEGTIF